ncbi:MAG: hypothetical protein WDM89_04520 [Rhizomicrobium sp.]
MTSFNVGQNNYEITPTGINNNEVVIGYFTNYENSRTGFIREGSGKIKTFTLPKAVVVLTENITDSGLFAGTYYDKSWVRKAPPHSFFAKSARNTKNLKAPGCAHTIAGGINIHGDIAGSCLEKPLGFIRTP